MAMNAAAANGEQTDLANAKCGSQQGPWECLLETTQMITMQEHLRGPRHSELGILYDQEGVRV